MHYGKRVSTVLALKNTAEMDYLDKMDGMDACKCRNRYIISILLTDFCPPYLSPDL